MDKASVLLSPSGRWPTRVRAWRSLYVSAVQPGPTGLPNLVVMLAGPAVFIFVAAVLVAFGISGTSSGAYWAMLGSGADPSLIVGVPRPIRSDEWLVQSSWVISQVQQGFPIRNLALPGGMDATIQNDLPSLDWSTAFRPHVWGLFLLPLDNGMAVRWALPAVVVLICTYWFVVTVLPSSPLVAVLLAVSALVSPIAQWWFLPTTHWPIAFAFLAITATIWGLRSPRQWHRWVMAGATGYLAVAMAMSIYVPFIVPAVLAAVVVALGFIVAELWRTKWDVTAVAGRLVPLGVSAVVAASVLGVWVLTRADTVTAVTSTVYPGERIEPTGISGSPAGWASLFSAPFQRVLMFGESEPFDRNQSEASAPFMLAVFLIPMVLWAVVVASRGTRSALAIPLISVLVSLVISLAFLFIPGWDALAHALFLDRTTGNRMRLIFLILEVVAVTLLIGLLRELGQKVPWAVTLFSAALSVAASAGVLLQIRSVGSLEAARGISWIACTLLLVATITAVSRLRPLLGVAALAVATVIVGLGVNPLYVGVFDLRATETGRAVSAIDAREPSADWVGIGVPVPTALLVETGVGAFNGVQTYPPKEMWSRIDPAGTYENEWNRLANVSWVQGTGEPVVTNPVRDQIVVTFDSCSAFAQREVDYVLASEPTDQSCLTPIAQYNEGPSIFLIYEVDQK